MAKLDNLTKKLQHNNGKLVIAAFQPAGGQFETTNAAAYQDFKFSKPEDTMRTITPKVYPVTTRAPTAHFLTSAKKELKAH